ncbi:MAG: hypothetical protein HY723_04200 [Chloroflexi bacterium]|nr:hypothetical protein [Chloroflexota bacterium]
MKAFVCTYRRPLPKRRHWNALRRAADGDPALRRFLNEYWNSYFDWGDDPAFFAATHFIGDVRAASWGVCRPEVRARLREGDLVVFFCGRPGLRPAKEYMETTGVWEYFFIGYATVDELVHDRRRLWQEPRLRPYTRFYNVLCSLVGDQLRHHETFDPPHNEKQINTPYVIFDRNLSRLEVSQPLRVATWTADTSRQEVWEPGVAAQRLAHLLFGATDELRGSRLRTARSGFAHRHLRLLDPGEARGRYPMKMTVPELRAEIDAILQRLEGAAYNPQP